jgi:hypothetical protein
MISPSYCRVTPTSHTILMYRRHAVGRFGGSQRLFGWGSGFTNFGDCMYDPQVAHFSRAVGGEGEASQ